MVVVCAPPRGYQNELKAIVADGARRDFIDAKTRRTPLTACLLGWTVKGVPGCFSVTAVAAFLLEQSPQLANMEDGKMSLPLDLVHPRDARDSEYLRALISKYLDPLSSPESGA